MRATMAPALEQADIAERAAVIRYASSPFDVFADHRRVYRGARWDGA